MLPMSNGPSFSLVVPVRCEAGRIGELHDLLASAAVALDDTWEVVYVDDGSPGETPAELRRRVEDDARVRVVELSRSFGWEGAALAGLDHATGSTAIAIDPGRCDASETLAALVAAKGQGAEIVRGTCQEPPAKKTRRCPLRGYCGWIASRSRQPGQDAAERVGPLLFDAKSLDALRRRVRDGRPLGEVLDNLGFRQAELTCAAFDGPAFYEPPPAPKARPGGMRIVRLLSMPGALLVVAAIAYAGVSVALWPTGRSAGTVAHIAALLAGVVGAQLLVLAVVADRIVKYMPARREETDYVVRDKAGFEGDSPAPADKGDGDTGTRYSVFT
jgi:hypothetical protein